MQTHAATRFAHPARNTHQLDIQEGAAAADFGAGSGHYAFEIARQLGNTGLVYAIDVQRDLLRRLKREAAHRDLKNIETILADIEQPRGSKLADRSCDLVLISNLLFQLQDPGAALTEARRVLKPSGRLAVIDWSDSFRSLGPAKQHVVKKARVLELARSAHFELLREFDAGAHHYGLVFRLIG